MWVYFGTRGFVWEVGDFQFCYVVGSMKYKKNWQMAIGARCWVPHLNSACFKIFPVFVVINI